MYTHLGTGVRPNAFGGTDFYADNEVMVFDPAGLFSRKIPAGEDGSQESLSFFQPERDSDKLLIIGGDNYLRRDGRR